MEEYITTNLLLAALLIVGNAEIADIEIGPRFSKVKLNLKEMDKTVLATKFKKLIENLNEENVDWVSTFDRSILGDIEDKYLRLKRMIFQARK